MVWAQHQPGSEPFLLIPSTDIGTYLEKDFLRSLQTDSVDAGQVHKHMDLHILKPECGIGIHCHRDNREIFFLLSGIGIMVTGDWCQSSARERCFEIRTMTPGS